MVYVAVCRLIGDHLIVIVLKVLFTKTGIPGVSENKSTSKLTTSASRKKKRGSEHQCVSHKGNVKVENY